MGGRGGRVVRNMYKGHMDKAKEGRMDSRRQEWVGQGLSLIHISEPTRPKR